MSRIAETCATARGSGRKLLIPYIVAGDPSVTVSLALMHSLVERGADLIELGFPFSDPASDGPVIQLGVERALAAGTSLRDVLDLVAQFRRDNQHTPIVLMGYLNPIERMGYAEFAERASAVGADGVLIVDMPPAESGELHRLLREAGLETIFLVAPTTSASRAEAIVSACSGYVYYVSLKGVTGAALAEHDSIAQKISLIKELTDLPVVIGFGIKNADDAAAMGKLADGVVIGSSLVAAIAELDGDTDPKGQEVAQATALIGLARDALDTLK